MGKMQYYSLQDYVKLLKEKGLLVEERLNGNGERLVKKLTYNSREVKEDTVFICKGAAFKPAYLREALEKGAFCYISEKTFELEEEAPYILVKDIRLAMAKLANMFYNRPWEDLKITGIGGTKGKSTSVYYMKAIVDDYMAATEGRESAMLSSIDIYDGIERIESHITTPEAMELQRYLRNAVNSGITYAQMEVSSQALKYHRVEGMLFDVGIFLNISEDHISPIEHPDFEDYFSSKLKMFARTKTAVVNLDADYAKRILEEAKAAQKVLTFSMKDSKADYFAHDIESDLHGTKFMVKGPDFDEAFEICMPGIFNVENALGVIAAADELKIPREYIHSGLLRARADGRMELYVSKDKNIVAIVDFAHNKLSFEKLFSSMKEEYPDYSIISVFGSPGNKAFTRRRDMGTVAGQYADYAYLTMDDPGYEAVEDICKEIARYVEEQNCPYEIVVDRGEAIRKAVEHAKGKTLLLITGKGADTNQKIGNEYVDAPSDGEYVKKYLAEYDAKVGE